MVSISIWCPSPTHGRDRSRPRQSTRAGRVSSSQACFGSGISCGTAVSAPRELSVSSNSDGLPTVPFFRTGHEHGKTPQSLHPTSRVTNSLKHCPQVDQQSHPRHSTAFGSSSAGVFSCSMSVSANGALRLKLPVAPWKKTAAPSNLSGGTSSKKTIRWAPPAILCSSG